MSDELFVARLTELHNAGLSAAQIGDQLDRSARTIARWRVRLGLSDVPPGYGLPISPAKLAQVRQMVEDGASHTQIAATLHVSRGTLSKFFPGTGWDRRQGGTYAQMVRALNRLAA